MRESLRELVTDTLAYVEQEHPSRPKKPPEPKKVAPPPLPRVEKVVAAPLPSPVPKEEAPPPVVKAVSVMPSEDLRGIIQKVAPQIVLHRDIPNDKRARSIATAWKEQALKIEVCVISFGETGKQLAFLENLATAIDVCLQPARLIDGPRLEKEKKWELLLASEHLKWIIAPNRSIGKSAELTRFYREIPATQERFLGQVPILFLAPFNDYFTNFALKRSLWSTLCQHLQR